MSARTLQEELAALLQARGWRYRNLDVRCWQDPLNPDGELVGVIAAVHRELRREKDPGAEIGRALDRLARASGGRASVLAP